MKMATAGYEKLEVETRAFKRSANASMLMDFRCTRTTHGREGENLPRQDNSE